MLVLVFVVLVMIILAGLVWENEQHRHRLKDLESQVDALQRAVIRNRPPGSV